MSQFLEEQNFMDVFSKVVQGIYSLIRLDSKILMSKELGNSVYDNFHYFWKTSKYNDVGLLLLMSLMVKEKEIRDSNSQIQEAQKWPKNFYVCHEGELITCSCRDEIAKIQM